MTESEAKEIACRWAALAIQSEQLRKGARDCFYEGHSYFSLWFYFKVLWLSVANLWKARRSIRRVSRYDSIWSRTAMAHLYNRLRDCKPFDFSAKD